MKRNKTPILLIALFTVLVMNVVMPFTIVRAATGTFISMSDPKIRYLGRWKLSSDGQKASMYFESGLELNFSGSSIAVNVASDEGGFAYSIDGGDFVEVTSASGFYTLTSGMPSGIHHLKLYGRFENSRPQFSGFMLDSGASLGVPNTNKTIEFIGDSITAGWIGGDGVTGAMKYSHTWQTAEKLGFSYNSVAYGGIALAKPKSDILSMAERYFKTEQYKSGETAANWTEWNTSKYKPDYIVINLGTNDSAASDRFNQAYVGFLADLRTAYPNAFIFAMAPIGGKYRLEINDAVIARYNSGDKRVAFINTYGWISGTDTTDAIHPTIEGQKKMAGLLADAIGTYLSNPGGTGIGKSISVADKNINYLGRFVISDDSSSVQMYFGSGFELCFTGTSLSFGFSGRFIYSVDGGEFVDIKFAGPGIFNEINGLSPGVHKVKIYCRYESERTRISNLMIDAGASTVANTVNKKIEFIGDSITAGWIGDSAKNYGLHYSYALKTGELLGFSHNTVAFGGIRLLDDGGTDPLGMAKRYYKTVNYNASEPINDCKEWNTANYTPDYIVINLGTNDRADSEVFKKTYTSFLKSLRKSYPNAVIFAISPIAGRYRADISKVVSDCNKAGDKKIVFINTYGWITGTDTTDAVHPSIEAQGKLAKLLAEKITEYIKNPNLFSENNSTVTEGGNSGISSGTNTQKPSGTVSSTSTGNIISGTQEETDDSTPVLVSGLINNGKGYAFSLTAMIISAVFATIALATAIYFTISAIKKKINK